MIDKAFVRTPKGLIARVTFTLPDSLWADAVYLVGDFNDWNRTSHPFRQDRQGQWILTVDLEPGRAYQFRYLCNGQNWMNDSQADAHVYNHYGSDNFVIITDPEFKRYNDESPEDTRYLPDKKQEVNR
ncbi:MAG: isoamylase early set domain-containing protein [Anaerolineae bacterium]|jgi:1,4-alpha-glucan branching enzyme